MNVRFQFAALLSVCALILTMLLAVSIGTFALRPSQIVSALRAGPPPADDADISPARIIIWNERLPRVLLAALVGASLALAGVAFQSLLRNDLADPYIVGVSAGASVGAEAVYLKHGENWLGGLAGPLAAFGSAMAAMMIVYGMARRGGRVAVTSLLLAGVVVSAFLGGVSTFLLLAAHPNDLQQIQYRLSGSLAGATFGQCGSAAAFLTAGFLMLLTQARAMNVFALGEEAAQNLGIEIERFKTILIATGSLLTAATVAVAGIIGFVGLMVPHIARRVSGTPDHARVLPLAALLGGILMVCADTLARTLMDALFHSGVELPVGIVTAFLGAPFFVFLLRRQQKMT